MILQGGKGLTGLTLLWLTAVGDALWIRRDASLFQIRLEPSSNRPEYAGVFACVGLFLGAESVKH